MNEQMWIELVGGIVIAKLRGPVSAPLLEECQSTVSELRESSPEAPVLYDALELSGPEGRFEPPDLRVLDSGLQRVRGAIVLADSRLRNPLRTSIGEVYGECRIFDNDLDAAYSWVCAAMRMSTLSTLG